MWSRSVEFLVFGMSYPPTATIGESYGPGSPPIYRGGRSLGAFIARGSGTPRY